MKGIKITTSNKRRGFKIPLDFAHILEEFNYMYTCKKPTVCSDVRVNKTQTSLQSGYYTSKEPIPVNVSRLFSLQPKKLKRLRNSTQMPSYPNAWQDSLVWVISYLQFVHCLVEGFFAETEQAVLYCPIKEGVLLNLLCASIPPPFFLPQNAAS